MKRYTHFLFDADNTLFDFDGASRLAFARLMQRYDQTDSDVLYALYKRCNAEVWKQLEDGEIDQQVLRGKRFELFSRRSGIVMDPLAANTHYLSALVEASTLLPGAMDLLNQLRSRIRLALVTNGLKEVQRPRVERTKLTTFFDTIVVSDEIGVAKPQPAFFDHCFRALDFPPHDQVLMIGDSLNSDIQGGRLYGLDTCWFNPTGRLNDSDERPTYEIKRLSELLPLAIDA